MSIFINLLPGWLELVFIVYWVVTIVLLIMDDREPSITLAWLFILVFLPLIGVFFYIFFGRDWKVVARRKGWFETLKRVEIEELDAKGDTKADCAQLGILPDCVGSFEGKNAKAEAISRMANIVNAFGSPLTIETSDAIPRRDKV